MPLQAPLPTDPVREIISELGSVPSSGSNAEVASSQDDEVTLALVTGSSLSEEGRPHSFWLRISPDLPFDAFDLNHRDNFKAALAANKAESACNTQGTRRR